MTAEYRSLQIYDFRTRFQLFDSQWPGNIRTPLRNLTLSRLLELASQRSPEQVALVDAGPDHRRAWTYAELINDVRRTAGALSGGFAPCERIAVGVHDPVRHEILRFAAATAGLPTVMLGMRSERDDATFAGLAGCAGLITDGEVEIDPVALAGLRVRHLADLSEEVSTNPTTGEVPSAPVGPGDVAEIRFGRDATGTVRGVELAHQGLTNSGQLLAERLESGVGEVWVFVRGAGIVNGPELTFAAMSSGGTCVSVLDDPALILSILDSDRAAILVCEPNVIDVLRSHDDFAQTDLTTLRSVICGASTVGSGLARAVEEEFGAHLHRTFGTIETGGVLCAAGPGDSLEDRSRTVGQPLPHTDVKIVVPGTTKIVPLGTPGEILVRSFAGMVGYVGDLDDVVPGASADGWLRTGQTGSLDKWGYLTPGDS